MVTAVLRKVRTTHWDIAQKPTRSSNRYLYWALDSWKSNDALSRDKTMSGDGMYLNPECALYAYYGYSEGEWYASQLISPKDRLNADI